MSDNKTFGEVGTSLVFENDQIRVWELALAPGERSDLHRHEHDYLMVQIAGDEISAQFEPESEGTFAGADELSGPVSPGTVIFAEAGGIETAVNIGSETFQEIVVELKSEASAAGSSTVSGMRLGVQHVSLNVANLEAALPFYTEVLGLEVLPRPDFGVPGAWLDSGNGIQIHLIEDPNFAAPSGPHVAFETADIEGELSRLRSLGVEVGDPFDIGGGNQAFFFDPSGNQFELNQPSAG